MTNPAHIANAYVASAKVNHYLVRVNLIGVVYDELAEAEQILISRDNDADNADETLNLALDLIEADISAWQRGV